MLYSFQSVGDDSVDNLQGRELLEIKVNYREFLIYRNREALPADRPVRTLGVRP